MNTFDGKLSIFDISPEVLLAAVEVMGKNSKTIVENQKIIGEIGNKNLGVTAEALSLQIMSSFNIRMTQQEISALMVWLVFSYSVGVCDAIEFYKNSGIDKPDNNDYHGDTSVKLDDDVWGSLMS